MRTLATGVAVGVAFAVGLLLAARPSAGPAAPENGPDAARAGLRTERLLDESPGGTYDAVYDLAALPDLPPPGAGMPEDPDAPRGAPPLRLYCDVLDEANYLALDLYPGGIRLGISEGGLFAVRQSLPPLSEVTGSGDWPETLRLRRRWPALELVADGRRVFRTVVEGFPGGRVGLGVREGEGGRPLVQPVDPIVFLDDFMREPGRPGDWTVAGAAVWRIRGLENPARSSNAFVFEGEGPDAGAVLVGRADWTEYAVAVSALGQAGGTIGLVLAAGESPAEGALPERACILRWTAGAEGVMQIVERLDGEERVLAERSGGYRPGQWYRLQGRLLDGRAALAVDGHVAVAAESAAFSGGRAGLWVGGPHAAEFDDVEIRSLRELSPDAPADRWLFVGPGWTAEGGGVRGEAQTALRTFAIRGRPDWRNVAVEADLRAESAPAGLVAAWRDPANYLACIHEPDLGVRRLVHVEDGVERILAEERAGRDGPLALRLDRGVVRSGALAGFVPDATAGRVGLLLGPGGGNGRSGGVRARSLRAEVVSPPKPEVSANEVFGDELLMAAWSGGAGDWRPAAPPAGYERAWWHRAYFFGDAEIEAELPESLPEAWTLALSLGKPEMAEERNNGYVLLADLSPVGGVLVLNREGQGVARAALEAGVHPRRLRLRRAGPFLLVYVDDRLRFHWRDPEPLEGRMAAWAEGGLELPPESVRMVSRNQVSEAFNSAPAAWRPAGGVWQVTNRWECDPRWSFMAGMPPAVVRKRIGSTVAREPGEVWLRQALIERLETLPATESEVAALWHKRTFRGAVHVDGFLAPIHLRSDGNYTRTAKNYGLTIGGDGRDLSSGYAFILAGWGNRRSAILKDGEVVAEQEGGIPQIQGMHRRWLHVRASVGEDGMVAFTGAVQITPHGGEEVFVRLAYSDPDPVREGQVAVWSYDAGMLVARLRVSAGAIGPLEDPFADYPAVSPCVFAPDPEVAGR